MALNLVKKKEIKTKSEKEIKTDPVKTAKKEKRAYRVLVKPLITEKLNNLKEKGKYAFEIFQNANKIEVSKSIEELYGIKPLAVNIIKVLGKRVRRGKISGKRKDWKKAIITLPKGKTIQIYKE